MLSKNLNFKKAKTDYDFEIIENLADVIWREHYIAIVGKPQIDYMLEKFQSAEAVREQIIQGLRYYIIEFEGENAGYLAMRAEDDLLFLSKIYVHKIFRGKNIGKRAIEFVEIQAKKNHLRGIRLTVNINNRYSIAFYEKLGFINQGSLITDIGNGFIMDDYEMLKKL